MNMISKCLVTYQGKCMINWNRCLAYSSFKRQRQFFKILAGQ